MKNKQSPRRKESKICNLCGVDFYPLYSSEGKYCSTNCSSNDRLGEKHPLWKGNDAGYVTVHSWNNRKYPKSGVCSHCGEKETKHHWALIKGKSHSRNISNYTELCVKCHVKYDTTRDRVKEWKNNLSKTPTHKNPIVEKRCGYCAEMFLPAKKIRRFCSNSCSKKSSWLALNKSIS